MPSLLFPGFRHPLSEPIASRRHTGRFVLIVTAIAIAGLLQATRNSGRASHIPLYLSIIGLQLLFLRFVFSGIRARGLRLIDLWGTRPRRLWEMLRDLAIGLGLAVVLRAGVLLFGSVARPALARTVFLLPHGKIEAVLWVAVSLVAGICEELIYRGYLQWQIASLIRSLPVAVGLQALVFGCAHIYQGWYAALITVFYGLAFGLTTAWRRSVVPAAIAHALVDIIAGIHLA